MTSNSVLSDRMRSIRSKNTKPELVVRKMLHALGYRFRLHQKKLPGTPDIVLPRHGAAILVHGCFWHQHPGCALAKKPHARPDYWLPKLERNTARDRRARDELAAQGWKVIVIWECETFEGGRLKQILIRRLAHGRRSNIIVKRSP